MFQIKLINKKPFQARIGGMRLKLAKLQESNKEVCWKIKAKELKEGSNSINRVFHY